MSDTFKKVYFTCKKLLCKDGTIRTYCQCDGCYRVGTVNIMKFPKTLYWDKKHLTTKYTTRWYCDECVGKLFKAIRDNRVKNMFTDDLEQLKEQTNETWHGYHNDLEMPKGTFERIFNDCEENNDDV